MIEERHRPSFALQGALSVLLAIIAGIVALANGHYVLGPTMLVVAGLLAVMLVRSWRSHY